MSTQVFLTTTGANTWTVPSDWNNFSNTIEVIGAGGGGGGGEAGGATRNGGGAGAGGYSKISNLSLTLGASVNYTIGTGGSGGATGSDGIAGGDTWFNGASLGAASLGCAGGAKGLYGGSGGTGGTGSTGTGSGATTFKGGNGGTGGAGSTYGGGGAAGLNGNGANGTANGGTGDAGSGGAGGTGAAAPGNGTEYDGTHGSGGGVAAGQAGGPFATPGSYGGAGGGGSGGGGAPGSGTGGAQGLIVITYTAVAITFDASSSGGLTVAHTCTGSNRLLLVAFAQQGNDVTPTCSYNGVSMTLLTQRTYTNGRFGMFYLINPASGTNNIIATSTADQVALTAASYAGVSQTGIIPDANTGAANNVANTGFTASNTSVADRCWTMLGAGVQGNGVNSTAITASTGATQRVVNNSVNVGSGLYDSNSAKTPAGSVSEALTFASGRNGYTIVSFSPFIAGARYWVGGTGTWDSSSTTHWSSTSGGSGGASVPTLGNVIFDANSGGGTVTLSADFSLNSLDFTGFTGTFAGSNALNISGSLSLATGMTVSYTGAITFSSTSSSNSITNSNNVLSSNITFNGIGGVWTLQDKLQTTGSVTLTNGTFAMGSTSSTFGSFSSSNSNTRTLSGSFGTLTLTGTGTVWNCATSTGMTTTFTTYTIKLNDASSSSKTFAGGGLTYSSLYLTGAGTGTFTISGSNTFTSNFKVDTPPHTVIFTAGTTQTLNTFTVNGTAGNLMTLQSTSSGTTWRLLKSTSGNVSCDYLSLQDSHVSST